MLGAIGSDTVVMILARSGKNHHITTNPLTQERYGQSNQGKSKHPCAAPSKVTGADAKGAFIEGGNNKHRSTNSIAPAQTRHDFPASVRRTKLRNLGHVPVKFHKQA
jgi:hypothetical protein